MSREAELIEKIDKHIRKAGGFYGLEFPDSDLRVIRASLVKRIKKKAVHHRCPACGNPATTETGDSFIDYYFNYCNYCGQALTEDGEPEN